MACRPSDVPLTAALEKWGIFNMGRFCTWGVVVIHLWKDVISFPLKPDTILLSWLVLSLYYYYTWVTFYNLFIFYSAWVHKEMTTGTWNLSTKVFFLKRFKRVNLMTCLWLRHDIRWGKQHCSMSKCSFLWYAVLTTREKEVWILIWFNSWEVMYLRYY